MLRGASLKAHVKFHNVILSVSRTIWFAQPSASLPDAFGQEAGKHVGIAAEHTKQWNEEHPGETAGMIACVVAAPLGIGVAHGVLRMVGFTAKGIAVST